MADGDARRDEVATGAVLRELGQIRVDHNVAMEKLEVSFEKAVGRIEVAFAKDITRIEQAINKLVSAEVYRAEQREVDRRISGVERWQEWAIRLVLAMVITAVVGSVLVVSGAVTS